LPHATEANVREKAGWRQSRCGERKIHRRKVHDDAGGRIEIVNVEFRLLGKIENDARARLVADDACLIGDERLHGQGLWNAGDECGDRKDNRQDKGTRKPRDSRAKRHCPIEYRCAAREIHGLQEIPYFSHFS